MYQNTIPDLPKLQNENYENIFNIFADKDGFYYYNLLQTVIIPSDLPKGYYDNYNVLNGDTWPYISYKVYSTPNLWWLITAVNNIINPLEKLEPGTSLSILKTQYVSLILNQISTQKL